MATTHGAAAGLSNGRAVLHCSGLPEKRLQRQPRGAVRERTDSDESALVVGLDRGVHPDFLDALLLSAGALQPSRS